MHTHAALLLPPPHFFFSNIIVSSVLGALVLLRLLWHREWDGGVCGEELLHALGCALTIERNGIALVVSLEPVP